MMYSVAAPIGRLPRKIQCQLRLSVSQLPSDGPMTDAQIQAVNGNVLHVPTVLGAVVVTYNLPALGATKLKFDGDLPDPAEEPTAVLEREAPPAQTAETGRGPGPV